METIIADIKDQTRGFIKVEHLDGIGRVQFTVKDERARDYHNVMRPYFEADFEVGSIDKDSYYVQYRDMDTARGENINEMSKFLNQN